MGVILLRERENGMNIPGFSLRGTSLGPKTGNISARSSTALAASL